MNKKPTPDDRQGNPLPQKKETAPLSLDDCEPIESTSIPPNQEESWDNIDADRAPATRDQEFRDLDDDEFPFPKPIAMVGWVLMVSGGLWMTLKVLITFYLVGVLSDRAALASGACLNGILSLVVPAFVIYSGFECIRGEVRDPIWTGIGTLVLGLILAIMACGWLGSRSFPPQWLSYLVSISMLICGLCVLGSGVIALLFRSEYVLWRESRANTRRARR